MESIDIQTPSTNGFKQRRYMYIEQNAQLAANTGLYYKFEDLARSEAYKSDFRCQMAAIIVRGGTPISIGHNYIKSHPKAYWEVAVHAELDAILNCRTHMTKAKILVYRFLRSTGGLAVSKPCDKCLKNILSTNISSIYYMNDEENIELMRV